jgi:hypothetical protein
MLRAAAVVGFLVTMSLQPVQSASAQTSEATIPRLVVHARGIAGEPLPLGLTIEGGADGAVVIVTGLVPPAPSRRSAHVRLIDRGEG